VWQAIISGEYKGKGGETMDRGTAAAAGADRSRERSMR